MELTYYWSEVVHSFTMEQVIRKKIPIRIKNVENPTGGGTVIDASQTQNVAPAVPILPHPKFINALSTNPGMSEDYSQSQYKKLPTAVTIKEHILVLNVNSNRESVSHGFLAGIFETLDLLGVVVDLISTSDVHVSVAIEDGLARKLLDRLETSRNTARYVSYPSHLTVTEVHYFRSPSTPKWPSSRSLASRCVIWSV